MKHLKTALLVTVLSGIALPAVAGGFAIDLPNLWFPEPAQPVISQGCANPAVAGGKCVTK